MANLQSRLQKLEVRFRTNADGSGLMPHSQEWVHFWIKWLLSALAGEATGVPDQIPIGAYRAVVAYVDELAEFDDDQQMASQA